MRQPARLHLGSGPCWRRRALPAAAHGALPAAAYGAMPAVLPAHTMGRNASGGRILAASALLALLAACPALCMPDTLGRPLWREVCSSSPSPSPPPERRRVKNEALSRGARRARTRGKYKADALQDPQHWVRGEDPAHPNMRLPVDIEDAHTVNIMPENSFWKDHDSDVSVCPSPL